MAARFRINDRGIKALQAPGGDVDRAVHRAAEKAKDYAQTFIRQHRYRDPGIAASIRVRRSTATPTGRVRYVVSARFITDNGADLAKIYEHGSRPHDIRVKGKPLVMQNRFTRGRKVVVVGEKRTKAGHLKNTTFIAPNTIIVFQNKVRHPGTKGIHYLEKAVRKIKREDYLR